MIFLSIYTFPQPFFFLLFPLCPAVFNVGNFLSSSFGCWKASPGRPFRPSRTLRGFFYSVSSSFVFIFFFFSPWYLKSKNYNFPFCWISRFENVGIASVGAIRNFFSFFQIIISFDKRRNIDVLLSRKMARCIFIGLQNIRSTMIFQWAAASAYFRWICYKVNSTLYRMERDGTWSLE